VSELVSGIVEDRIDARRPAAVPFACAAIVLTGLGGVWATFWALVPLPGALFPGSKPLLVLLACALLLSGAVGLARGLYRARLWCWFGAVSAGIVGAALPGLVIENLITGGLAPWTVLELAPLHVFLASISLVLLALLWLRGVRNWFFASHRLRSLPPQRLAGYVEYEWSTRGRGRP
jgi:hypothetical protein